MCVRVCVCVCWFVLGGGGGVGVGRGGERQIDAAERAFFAHIHR